MLRASSRLIGFVPAVLFAVFAALPAQAIDPLWTHNTQAPILASPQIADIDGDGFEDVILTTYGLEPNPYGSGWVHVLDRNGTPLTGWPFFSDFGPFPACACVGDVDGNPGVEVVALDWSRLHVLDASGNELPGWPRSIGGSWTPALADVDDDGDVEMIVPSGQLLHLLQEDGTEYPGWPVLAPDQIGSPAVGDIDGDGEVEIAAGTLQGPVGPDPFELYVWELDGSVKAGFPRATSGTCKAPPAMGDIDGDGVFEIVVPAYDDSNNDYIYVFDADGNDEPGWPQRAGRCRLSPPALADVDDDGQMEIFIGGGRVTSPLQSMLFAFEPDGTPLPGFPLSVPQGAQINAGPVVADLDGDPTLLEIVVKVQDYIYAYHSDGTPLAGFPYFLDDTGHTGTTSPTPAIGDLDDDGDAELVVCSTYDRMDLLDFEAQVDMNLAWWPSMKRDAQNTSFLGFDLSYVHEGRDRDGPVLVLRPCVPNPVPGGHEAWLPFSWTGSEERILSAARAIDVFDPAGRLIRRLPLDARSLQHGGIAWDGRDLGGRQAPAGVYLYRLAGREDARAQRIQVLR